MSDIPKSKRKKSKLQASVDALNIRTELGNELLMSFALSPKRMTSAVEKATRGIKSPEEKAARAEIVQKAYDGFAPWFIERHRSRVDDLCCDICQHIRAANSIWPSYRFEFNDRRREWNQALVACNKLQDELQYIAETIPADKNKYTNVVLEIDALVEKIKRLRQSDNRFLKNLKD